MCGGYIYEKQNITKKTTFYYILLNNFLDFFFFNATDLREGSAIGTAEWLYLLNYA